MANDPRIPARPLLAQQIGSFGAPSPVTAQKQASLEAATRAKEFLVGSPFDMAVANVAVRNGNRLGNAELVQDLKSLNDFDFARKYGMEALGQRHRYDTVSQSIGKVENADREAGAIVTDTLGSAGKALNAFALDTASLGAGLLVDKPVNSIVNALQSFGVAEGLGRNPSRTSEAIGSIKQGIDTAIDATRSRELRESTELDAIRSSLDAADNQAQYAEDLESGRGRLASEIARFGRGFSNRIDNLVENPIVALDVTTQSAGYMLGLAPTVRKGASMLAAKELSKKGLTKADITQDAYQALLAEKTKQVVPLVVGVTEAGGSFSENQLEVLAMDEAELADSPAYQDLRNQNYTHEEARSQIALNQGLAGAALTLPAAYLSGKIGTAFEANPLAVAGSGLVGRGASAAKNIGLEVVEEAIQGANSQLAGKAAEAFAQSVDVDYGEGLGEVVAESVLAAGGMAAGLQAPGVALGAAGQAAKATGAAVAQAAGKVSQARQEAAQARTLEGSGVTPEDLNTAAQDAEQALTEIIADRPAPAAAEPEVQTEVQTEVLAEDQTEASVIDLDQTTPQQTEALQTPQAPQAPQVPQVQEPESDPLVQPLEQALTLTEDEIEGFSAAFPAAKVYVEEAASQGKAPSRPAMVNALSQSIEDPALEPEQQMSAAINTVMLFQEMANADSDAVRAQYDALPEDSLDRRRVDRIRKSIDTLSSSPALQKARDRIKELDYEKLSAIIPPEALKDETLPDNVRKGLIDAIRVIGELNPSALSPDMPKAALNQLDAMQKARKYSKNFSARQKQQNDRYLQKTKKSLQALDRMQERVIVRSQEAKKKIEESQAARIAEAEQLIDDGEVIESFDGKPLTKADLAPTKTSDVVQQEIRFDGNGKKGSLQTYASEVLGFLDQGQIYRAALRMRELRRFAQSQLNKLEAFNESAAAGDGKGRDYTAWNGVQEYLETAKRTAVHLHNPASVALAQDVHADTDAAVQLFNLLSRDYGDLMNGLVNKGELDALPEPVLHENVSRAANSVYAPKKAVGKKNGDSVSGNGRDAQKTQETTAEGSSAGAARADEPAEGRAAPEAPKAIVSDDDGGPAGDQRTGRAESEPGDAARTDVREGNAGQQARETEEEDPESDVGDDDADADAGSDAAERENRLATFRATFGSLLGTREGFNRFLKAFKPRKTQTLLMSQEKVGAHIIENIEDLSKIAQSKLSRPLTLEEKAGVVQMLQAHLPGLVKSLNAEVQKVLTEGGQNRTQNGVKSRVSYSEMVESDPQALSFQNLLTLNLAEKLEDGTYRLHPKAAGAMSLAALEWLVSSQDNLNRARVMDREDVAEALGEDIFSVSESLVRAFNEGTPHKFLVEDLAQKFSQFLGISPESSAPQSDTQGIPQALAATMIEQMADQGWITISSADEGKFTIPLSRKVKDANGNPGNRIYEVRTVRVNENSPIMRDLKLLKNQPDILSTLVSPEAEKMRYVGEAPKKVEPYKIHSKTNKLSRKERAVVERLQNMEHKLNLPLWNFVNAFSDVPGGKPGQSVFNYLLGYRAVDGKDINMAPSVLESQKGKNQALMSQLAGVRGYVEEIMAHAGEDKNPSEIPVFFKFMISSVGRLQQQGPVTPQGSKIMRELINPTRAVLDLTTQEQDDMFWLAVAQSVGQKTEAKNHAQIIADTKAMFEEGSVLDPVLKILSDWYDRTDGGLSSGDNSKLNAEEQGEYLKALEEAVPVSDMTMKYQHALLEVVRYNQAKLAGGEAFSKFQTQLALEADGKTDGPINAFMHMMTGGFTEPQLDLLRSGGLFFSEEYTTLNDYYERFGGQDAYTKAAANLSQRLMQTRRKTNPESAEGRHFNALLNVMLALQANLSEFSDERGQKSIKAERNLLKNPLTVFFYGSGEKGIAGKIADAILTTFNEKLPTLMETMDAAQLNALVADLDLLLGTSIVKQYGDLQHYPLHSKFRVSPAKVIRNYRTAEFTDAQKRNMRDAVQHYFIPHALGAINDTMGKELKENMVLMQEVSAIQAKIFYHLFTQRLDARLAELKKDEKLYSRQYLSAAEVQKIFEETQKHAPIYETDAQTFVISGAERADTQVVAAKSLRNQLQTTVKSDQPSEPSVKVSPYMIIGTGDGRMILNIYLKQDGSLDVSLPVFDGVEMAANQIYAASNLINQGVYEGWMQGNVFGSIRESYERFLTTFDKDEVPIDMLSDNMVRLLGKKRNAPVTREHLIKVRDMLRHAENTNLARKRAIKRIKTWTDHMASARTPFESKGEAVSNAEVLDKLNAYYEEELSKLEGIQESKRNLPVQAEDAPWLKAAIEGAGKPVEGSNTKVLNGRQVLKILKNSVNLSRQHQAIIGQIFENSNKLDLSNVTFYFGDRPELTALRNTRFPVRGSGSNIERGFYDPARRIGYVSIYSAETMLHEMIHGLTADVVLRYYADPESLGEETRKSLQRLEAMMKEFRALFFDAENANVREAAEGLQEQLERLEGDPAAQVLEFMAWGLTNQHIIDVSQRNRVQSRLGKIVGKALRILKELLGFKGRVAEDFFSNLRFNAEVVMQAPGLDGVTSSVIPEGFGLNQQDTSRIAQIRRRYMDTLDAYLGDPLDALDAASRVIERDRRGTARLRLDREATDAMHLARRAGFDLSDAQGQAFMAIHAVMSSELTLNPAALRRLGQIYDSIISKLKEEHFYADPSGQARDAQEAQEAKLKLAFVQGRTGLSRNEAGRTDILANFLALTQVEDSARQSLSALEAPKDVKIEKNSFDDRLTSFAESAVNAMVTRSIDPKGLSPNALAQLDQLTLVLADLKAQTNLSKLSLFSKLQNHVDDYLADALRKGTGFVYDKAKQRANSSTSSAAQLAYRGVQFASGVLNAEKAEAEASVLTRFLNQKESLHTWRNLAKDVIGRTMENAPIFDLINRAKAEIQAIRQTHREDIPRNLAKKFSRTLKKEEWSSIHKGIGKMDLLALARADIIPLLLDPTSVSTSLQAAEEALSQQVNNRSLESRYKAHANALATFMATGESVSNHLFTNAYAIAAEAGTQRQARIPDSALVDAIDKYVSLKAFELLDAQTKEQLKELAENETDGLDALISTLDTAKRLEEKKLEGNPQAEMLKLNAHKGYIPEIISDGVRVVVADVRDQEQLVRRGYTKVADYTGDRDEDYRGRRAVYISTVAGKAAYKQGVAQTVHDTYMGADGRNGTTHGGITGGVVKGSDAQYVLGNRGRINASLAPGEYLRPVFNEQHEVVAYEMHIKPEHKTAVRKDTHAGRMIGAWTGRISEETAARAFNTELVVALKEIWDRDKNTRESEFVNLADPDLKDPIYKDAWKTLSWHIKDDAAEIFGRGKFFPVRRDMIEDAVGYRAAALTDSWTGVSRWSDTTQKVMRKTAETVFQEKAFKYLRQAEDGVTGLVSYAKTTIVIRSIKVILGNFFSNYGHLMMRGMDPITIAKAMKNKFIETDQYLKNQADIQLLTAEAAIHKDNPHKSRSLRARIRALQEANEALSIWPLIQAGELSTVSEDITEDDIALRQGRIADYIEGLVDKLPGQLKVLGKNAIVAKDTALFRGLSKGVQFGDFVAKAALYDHLTQKKGMSKEQSLIRISEEFVNYNRLAGRTRDALESFGLMWFYNYKLRIMKVAANTLRENPFSALSLGMGALPALDVDTVIDSNLIGKWQEGNLGYSLGPGMGLHSYTLAPMHQLWTAVTN